MGTGESVWKLRIKGERVRGGKRGKELKKGHVLKLASSGVYYSFFLDSLS